MVECGRVHGERAMDEWLAEFGDYLHVWGLDAEAHERFCAAVRGEYAGRVAIRDEARSRA
jgi:hypothetical protein